MSKTVLSYKVGVLKPEGGHDNSVTLFSDGNLAFAAETERFTRTKHAQLDFPDETIRIALDEADLSMADVDVVALPYDPELEDRRLRTFVDAITSQPADAFADQSAKEDALESAFDHYANFRHSLVDLAEDNLSDLAESVPAIRTYRHHRCHAASAFYPSGFDDALVLTVDGIGEIDSTVVWRGDPDGVHEVRSYETPNSLGTFYAVLTRMLGFRPLHDEGKVMGLAAYGEPNEEIEAALDGLLETGVEYDVTDLTDGMTIEGSVARLEDRLGRERKQNPDEGFDQWEKDLAFAGQQYLEETVTDVVSHYCSELGVGQVALSGGVALNCKMNKAIQELPCVDSLFVQPAANDSGVSLGAAMLEFSPDEIPTMESVYHGPRHPTSECERVLSERKIPYEKPDDLERVVAEKIADGALVGWYQGRMELGPRALGHRSILADPRDAETRDRVNEHVKHRETWRPFAPSMLAEAADEYLRDAAPAPFMIKTFDVNPEKVDEMRAVLHPGDDTTRPQTVREDVSPRYHELIREFERISGVPMLLNTSFNDSGEPIVNAPQEAIDDFYRMGLDALVLNDCLVEKVRN